MSIKYKISIREGGWSKILGEIYLKRISQFMGWRRFFWEMSNSGGGGGSSRDYLISFWGAGSCFEISPKKRGGGSRDYLIILWGRTGLICLRYTWQLQKRKYFSSCQKKILFSTVCVVFQNQVARNTPGCRTGPWRRVQTVFLARAHPSQCLKPKSEWVDFWLLAGKSKSILFFDEPLPTEKHFFFELVTCMPACMVVLILISGWLWRKTPHAEEGRGGSRPSVRI